MQTHLVNTDRLEPNPEGPVAVFLNRLVRMKQEGRSVRRRVGLKAQNHVDGHFLVRTERTTWVALGIDRWVPLKAFIAQLFGAEGSTPVGTPSP